MTTQPLPAARPVPDRRDTDRAALVRGIRRLADALEANPSRLPCPHAAEAVLFVTAYTTPSGSFREGGDPTGEIRRRELADILAILDTDVHQVQAQDPTFAMFEGDIDGLPLRLFVEADALVPPPPAAPATVIESADLVAVTMTDGGPGKGPGTAVDLVNVQTRDDAASARMASALGGDPETDTQEATR